jgi:hypothetical protein
VTSPILLLDADIIAFQLAATAQRSYRFPGMDTPAVAVDDWELQPERIDAAVTKLCEQLKTSRVIVCLSCPTEENWRLSVLPTYKGNRDYSRRPEHLAAIKDYLAETYPSYRRPTLEADDIMGILSTMKGLPKSLVEAHPEFAEPGKKIIVSEDKDMKTIPGWLFNPAKQTKPVLVSQEDADEWHLYQAICGDTVDNYAGCAGAGPDKAKPILDGDYWHRSDYVITRGTRKGAIEPRWSLRNGNGMSAWARVVSLFEKFGLTEDDALIQARVARICRASDYDFKNKEVILWTPSN